MQENWRGNGLGVDRISDEFTDELNESEGNHLNVRKMQHEQSELLDLKSINPQRCYVQIRI